MVRFSQLHQVCGGRVLASGVDRDIMLLATDSRKAVGNPQTLFFAIKGAHHDGHHFLAAAYQNGVRNFVVEQPVEETDFPEANLLLVPSSLEALQKLAAFKRGQFTYPVIGVTGSNGKTIVKEWLYQSVSPEYNCVKNPGSYNSQLGVPLSVWQMEAYHHLGIFEAGISKPGEMAKLQRVIRPTLGIFCNIGSAHDEGFQSRLQKIKEKALLFNECEVLIYCHDHPEIRSYLRANNPTERQLVGWGQSEGAQVLLKFKNSSEVELSGTFGHHRFHLPEVDHASRENLLHVICAMFQLGYSAHMIQERIGEIRPVPMRLEMKEGINGCQVIDDTYNNDLAGLQISLDMLKGSPYTRKTIILSDVLQSGLSNAALAREIASMVSPVATRLIGVGPVLSQQSQQFLDRGLDAQFFLSTDQFLQAMDGDHFSKEAILVKGARPFQFEKVVEQLQRKVHGTVMEVDLQAVRHNLNFFRTRLDPGVKLMVMVKAFAYGSGSVEIASLLQYHHVDYLGVAYADEGVDLRKQGIKLPIMVMNPAGETFGQLVEHNLEPEIYSMALLEELLRYLDGTPLKVHIKLDTGMHRLGFEQADEPALINALSRAPHLEIASVFTHLAGSETAEHDAFTKQQVDLFRGMYANLNKALGINAIRHVLNTGGILRFPQWQFEMVRLGVGLYGIDPSAQDLALHPVVRLKTVISQVKVVPAGATIGYGRRGVAPHESRIATIAIGYADGYSRQFGRGAGKVLVRGQLAPTIGNICMDMTMIDVTGIESARAGDEVIIFGPELPITEVANQIGTIPYELLTNTSDRVKRVFHTESF